MRNLNQDEYNQISGGNLTTTIMDFFRDQNSGSKAETEEWHSKSTIVSPALGKGEQYGAAIVTGIAAIALFSITLAGGLFKGLFR